MSKNVFSAAWKDATKTAEKASKARRAASKPPVKKRTKIDQTLVCDLCGRGLNKYAVKIGDGEVWCSRCVQDHTLYPIPCKSCDDRFHFPPGITDITDPLHAAMVADSFKTKDPLR